MSMAMTVPEREAFLADLHVGIIGIGEPGRGPLTVPIWYGYEPGGVVRIVTERASRKGKLLQEGVRISLCAQTETPPYKYASVEGPIVEIVSADRDGDSRMLAHRYLGPELGEQYIEATGGAAIDPVRVSMRPERWLTVDYAKQFGTG